MRSLLPFALVVACGGESGPIFGQPDASDATSSGDAASASDSSADAPSDAKGDVAPTDAGISNPGKVSCGKVECSAPAEVCCGTFTGTGTALACTEPLKCTGTAGACDESADCTSAQVCCLGVGSTWSPITRCKTSCEITDFQLCKTDAECGSKQCLPYVCGAGFTVRACTPPTC